MENTSLTISKEYYEEEAITDVYQDVIERLLVAVEEEEEALAKKRALSGLVNQQENIWPPWPWPPWGDDDDDKPPASNRTDRAHKLAKKVLKLESRVAAASLDL